MPDMQCTSGIFDISIYAPIYRCFFPLNNSIQKVDTAATVIEYKISRKPIAVN